MIGNPEFREDYANPRTSPLAPQHADFEWDELYARLGEAEGDDSEALNQKVATAMLRLLTWVVDTDLKRPRADARIGRRALALVWVLNPALIEGTPSLKALSDTLGLSPYPLAAITGEVCREFGIRNNSQRHAWNRKRKGVQRAAA